MGFNFAVVNRGLVEWKTIPDVNLRKCSYFDVASTCIEAALKTTIIILQLLHW